MLDILLINPNYSADTDIGEDPLPPLGICYISSYLKEKNIKSRVLDANALNLKTKDIFSIIDEENPKIVGLTSTTSLITNACKLADEIKIKYPDIIIIAGGPHVTALSEYTLKENKNIDIIVRGEGEIITYNLIGALKNGSDLENIKGITYRKNDDVLTNPPGERINDLDSLPFPDRSDLPIEKYIPSIKWFNRLPFATIMTSRGCPNDCVFCASKISFGRVVKFRSPQNVLLEIKDLIDKYKIREIMFYDDTFTLDKSRTHELCDLILKNKLDITWGCLSRVDRMDEELLLKMKKAGCHLISYGVESGSERMLNVIRKNINLDQVKETIKLTNKVGIDCSASFVFGVPGETKETMEKTIKFALEIDPLFAFFYRVVPFPGTDLFKLYLDQNKEVKHINWKNFLEVGDTENLIKLEGISSDDFNKILKESYNRFYWRPKKILQLLMKMSTPKKLKRLIIAGYSFIELSLSKSKKIT